MLNVSDKHKQSLSMKDLLEKQFIKKDFQLHNDIMSVTKQRGEFKSKNLLEPAPKLLPTIKETNNDSKLMKSHRHKIRYQ